MSKPNRDPSEAALIEQIARGNEDALARLYDLYAGTLFGLVLAILKSRPDAEEVLQEVFLQVWRRADRYEGSRASVYGWLVSMARSRAIDFTRQKNFRRHREALDLTVARGALEDDTQPVPLDSVLIRERAEAVREVLADISPRKRRVMELAYFHGHTQTEIAALLGIPLGTVKSRMRHGLAALQQRILGSTIHE